MSTPAACPVSVIVPALSDTGLLEWSLPFLEREIRARGAIDEVIVVDDSGDGALGPWLAERFPGFGHFARRRNGGFARALSDGIARARFELVLALNSDVRLRPGCIDALVRALEEERAFACAPKALRWRGAGGADETAVESLVRVHFEDGEARVLQPCLRGERALERRASVPFALGGACLLRRSGFAELGGFDPLFEPFYLEDVDLCWRAWRRGWRVVYEPAAVAEHKNQATIASVAPPELVLAAIVKNQILFQWKHLDEPSLEPHLARLEERALDGLLAEQQGDLVRIALALEQMDPALAARAAWPPGRSSFGDLARATDPWSEAAS